MFSEFLADQGLNLQHVFELSTLPQTMTAALAADIAPYRQLLLLGHGGRRLWQVISTVAVETDDPIDDFTVQLVHRYFQSDHPRASYKILYPGDTQVSLQRLGELAGWHSASPFMLGINHDWGSWFAYRALVLADTSLTPDQAITLSSPCSACEHRDCIRSCPASALDHGQFDLEACSRFRLEPDSDCAYQCLARNQCPVKPEHRYSDEQIRYHYGRSLAMIRQYRRR
ncbi:hypothetical protein [Gynuella sunshinyii]|uniref:Putative Fe-S protein n=1 Tax=Gynuella sunshinyii YC6258 TaxID=1445510 RepID=A0A0C5W3F2_9GAMM|nr:hypothetical protein [Gynuella sunshinyii]AJQ97164.1 putative Fe-S protein [Gynuella sunshinyii YC6258]